MPLVLLLPVIFASSLVLTMVGLGGGLIFSPLFLLLGFPVPTALSASLFLNGVAAISAAITYFRQKMVDVHLGIPLIIASTLAAPLGAYTTSRVNLRVITGILAVVILLAAMRMLFSPRLEAAAAPVGPWRRIAGGAGIGVLIGYLAGLLGIGGGVFVVPLLIYGLKVPTKKAAATSIFVVVFSSFSGFATHVSMAAVDWRFIVLATFFSFAGGQVGSRLMAAKLSGRAVRRIFGVVLLLFAFKLLQRTWL